MEINFVIINARRLQQQTTFTEFMNYNSQDLKVKKKNQKTKRPKSFGIRQKTKI